MAFVTVMVVSARYWPAFGERIAVRLSGSSRAAQDIAPKPSSDPPRE